MLPFENQINLMLQLGATFHSQALYSKAVNCWVLCSELLSNEPLNSMTELDNIRVAVAVNHGESLRCLGQIPEAIELCLEARNLYEKESLKSDFQLDRDRAGLYKNLGLCYKELGALDEAIEAFDMSLFIYYKRVLLWERQLDFTRAITLMNLGICFFEKELFPKALEAFEAIERLFEENDSLQNNMEWGRLLPESIAYRAKCLKCLGRPFETLELAQKAQEIYRVEPFIHQKNLNSSRVQITKFVAMTMIELELWLDALGMFEQLDSLASQEIPKDKPVLNLELAHIEAMKGRCYNNLRLFSEAKVSFSKSQFILSQLRHLDSEIEFENIKSFLDANWGACHSREKNFDEALIKLREAQISCKNCLPEPWAAKRLIFIENMIGVCLTNKNEIHEALVQFKQAHELFSSDLLLKSKDLCEEHALLYMNHAACLESADRLGDAVTQYREAIKLYENWQYDVKDRPNDQIAILCIYYGSCLAKLGEYARAYRSLLKAQRLFETETLKPKSEFDEYRARILWEIGNLFLLSRRPSRALEFYHNVQSSLSSTTLDTRSDLKGFRGNILINIGVGYIQMGNFHESLRVWRQVDLLYSKNFDLSKYPHNRGVRAKLLSNMSLLLSHMEDANAWSRASSRRLVSMLELAPRDRVGPWAEMRDCFARFHANWLEHCLETEDYETIPEVLLALQGREMLTDAALEQASAADPDGPVDHYCQTRKRLREIIEALRGTSEASGVGPSAPMGSDGIRMMAGPVGPVTSGPAAEPAHIQALNAEYRELHGQLGDLRSAAAAVDGFAWLNAGHSRITHTDLCAVLAPHERALILFPHKESSHGLLLGPQAEDGEASITYIPLPFLPAIAAQARRFDVSISGRMGIRHTQIDPALEPRDGHETDSASGEDHTDGAPKVIPFSNDEISQFWPEQVKALKSGLWDAVQEHMGDATSLTLLSAGDLHNLSLEPGRPDGVTLTRLPGLSFFALMRGLYTPEEAEEERTSTNDLDANQSEHPSSVAILVDEAATDIPLAATEGRDAARYLKGRGVDVAHPSSYPEAGGGSIGLLHVASHGGIRADEEGMPYSVIAHSEGSIGEDRIANAPAARHVFANICVGGQTYDNPLDGDARGLVGGFLRQGSDWVVTSLRPLPDEWTYPFGLLLTHVHDTQTDMPFPDVLAQTRQLYMDGGWPDWVTRAFIEAMQGKVRASKLGEAINTSRKSLVRDELAHTVSAWWWQEGLSDKIEAILRSAKDKAWTDQISALIDTAISETVAVYASTGIPLSWARDTVVYGHTLFGNPA